jgi:predicted  nucleic acid-binding Zn-ribbon protein
VIPEIESLWRAQSLDRALLAVRERLKAFPLRRTRVDAGLVGAKSALAAAEEKAKAAALAKRDAEKQAETLAAQELKFQGQLTQVKKNDEYAALLHEIAAAKSKREELETFVLERMEQEASVAAEVKRAKATLAEAEKGANGERATIAAEEAAVHAEESDLTARRSEALSTLPAVLRARYERILIARKGQAIAELTKDSCSGCGGRIPPQAAKEVRRGLAVVECPDCGRMLISPPEHEASV